MFSPGPSTSPIRGNRAVVSCLVSDTQLSPHVSLVSDRVWGLHHAVCHSSGCLTNGGTNRRIGTSNSSRSNNHSRTLPGSEKGANRFASPSALSPSRPPPPQTSELPRNATHDTTQRMNYPQPMCLLGWTHTWPHHQGLLKGAYMELIAPTGRCFVRSPIVFHFC